MQEVLDESYNRDGDRRSHIPRGTGGGFTGRGQESSDSEPRSSNNGSSWYNNTGWWSDSTARASTWNPAITLPTRGTDVYFDSSKGKGKGKGGRHSEGTSWWQGTSWSDQRYSAFGSPPPFNASYDSEFAGDPMNINDDDGDPPVQRRRR